jgi:hypothetical protein
MDLPLMEMQARSETILNTPYVPRKQPDMPYRSIFEPFSAHSIDAPISQPEGNSKENPIVSAKQSSSERSSGTKRSKDSVQDVPEGELVKKKKKSKLVK